MQYSCSIQQSATSHMNAENGAALKPPLTVAGVPPAVGARGLRVATDERRDQYQQHQHLPEWSNACLHESSCCDYPADSNSRDAASSRG